jgi:hypothetical protein
MNKNRELSRDWNYQYGIFARIRGKSSWGEEQVKMYMDRNDIPYKTEDTMNELVEALKCHEDKKYQTKK